MSTDDVCYKSNDVVETKETGQSTACSIVCDCHAGMGSPTLVLMTSWRTGGQWFDHYKYCSYRRGSTCKLVGIFQDVLEYTWLAHYQRWFTGLCVVYLFGFCYCRRGIEWLPEFYGRGLPGGRWWRGSWDTYLEKIYRDMVFRESKALPWTSPRTWCVIQL